MTQTPAISTVYRCCILVLEQFATPQIVETLVRGRANPNDKDTRDQNAAFLVLDRDVARELIRSDVDLGTVNKNGESCTQKQLRFGNRDIARLFMGIWCLTGVTFFTVPQRIRS